METLSPAWPSVVPPLLCGLAKVVLPHAGLQERIDSEQYLGEGGEGQVLGDREEGVEIVGSGGGRC